MRYFINQRNRRWGLMVIMAGWIASFQAANAGPVGGGSRTWLGTSGSNWSTTANWSGGALPTSTDSVQIDGAAYLSGITASGSDVNVGYNGTGSLVQQNGNLTAFSLYVGFNTSSTGAYTLTSGTTSVGTLSVGQSGAGTMTINGGSLSTTGIAYIGNAAGATGTVSLQSGTWNSSNTLYVGASGIGKMTVSGGQLNSNVLRVKSTTVGKSSLTFTGGAVNTGTFQVYSVAGASSGDFTMSGGLLSSTTAAIGYQNLGNAVISGGTWNNTDNFYIGGSPLGTGTTVYSGTAGLTLTDGGTLIQGGGTGTVTIGYTAASSGTLNLGNGGQAGTLSAGKVLGSKGSATVNFNHTGTYNFAPSLSGTLAVNKYGAGTTNLTGSSDFVGLTNVAAGRLNVDGSLLASGTVQVSSTATLSGSGSVGNVQLSGTLAPSASLSLTSLTMNAGSTLSLQTESVSQLKVSNSIALGGTLDLASLSNLSTVGQSWVLIDNLGVAAVSGTFSLVDLDGQPLTLTTGTAASSYLFSIHSVLYELNYAGGTGNDVTVTVLNSVPEPGTWAMMLVGGLGLLGVARRRRVGSAA